MNILKKLLFYLEKHAEKTLLACYAIFIACIALEEPINFGRTIFLLSFINYSFFNNYVIKSIYKSTSFRISLLFILISIASLITSPYNVHILRTLDWVMYIIFGITSVLLWKRNATLLLLIIPITCLFASIGTYAWTYINELPTQEIFTRNNRLFLYMSIPNRMGLLFASAAAICIGVSFILKKRAIPLLLLATALSTVCWLSQSRSAVFALLAIIILATGYAFYQNKKSPFGIALLLIGATLFGISSIFATNRILTTLSTLDTSYLLNGRDDIWIAAWEIFLKSPVVGFGINSFHDALGALLALPENADRFPAIRRQYTFWNAHQMVLGILCETGLAGLMTFGALIVRGIRTGIAKLPETLPPLLMLCVFLVHGIGAYGFHRSWNSAIFFLPLGILEGWKILALTNETAEEPRA